jgi:REP element-mobilizing transposase RayT
MCVNDRECLFGKIVNGKIRLNEYGRIADACWRKIQDLRTHVRLDEFVVMPNHIHGILVLCDVPTGHFVGATDPVARDCKCMAEQRATHRVAPTNGNKQKRPLGPKCDSIGAIIGQYKSVVTKQINTIRKAAGKSLWQRDFYDHIGRNNKELFQIRQYIRNNPAGWDTDDENPDNKSPRYVAMPNPQKMVVVI